MRFWPKSEFIQLRLLKGEYTVYAFIALQGDVVVRGMWCPWRCHYISGRSCRHADCAIVAALQLT